jgi:hypothetical protein
VAAMLLAGTPHRAIADTLGTDRRDILNRARRIVARVAPSAMFTSDTQGAAALAQT